MVTDAAASTYPWSGYWWPEYDDGRTTTNIFDNNGPLNKYDWYVYNTRGYNPNSAGWEYQNHRQTDPANNWFGKCHAVAAASILTQAPPAQGVYKGNVSFSQDDLEGLVTSLYYNPSYIGAQDGWGTPSATDNQNTAAFKDMDPAWMDYLLQYYVGQYNYPFVMDVSAGSQIWNYPAFAYSRNAVDNGNGSQSVSMRVWFTDAAKGASQTNYFSKDYSYTLWDTGNGTTGQWTGSSVANHPDFAWLPTGRQAGGGTNPNIDPAIVSEILGYQV